MAHSDSISRLADLQSQLQSKNAGGVVAITIDAIPNTLVKGGRMEIRGFGSFAPSYRPAYQGHNPEAGNKLPASAKYVPYFKTDKELKVWVDCNA